MGGNICRLRNLLAHSPSHSQGCGVERWTEDAMSAPAMVARREFLKRARPWAAGYW